MIEQDGPLARFLYPLLASVAGGVTALSIRPYRGMSAGSIILSVFVGFSFAYFVGPIAVELLARLIGVSPTARVQGGIYYLLASGSNALIPLAVRWLARGTGFQIEETGK